MDKTTITISTDTRYLLKQAAAREQLTMDELVSALAKDLLGIETYFPIDTMQKIRANVRERVENSDKTIKITEFPSA